MTGYLFLGALVIAALAVVAWKRAWFARREGRGWSAGPIIKGKNRSVGVEAAPDGSFAFPQPSWADGHIHYLTRATGPISRPIKARFRIDAAPGAVFINDTGTPAWVTLYVQREGNDWSARNEHERIFGTRIPLTPGEHTLEAGDWGGLLGHTVTTPADVADTLAHAARVGLVFGGGTGLGHGAFATGPARFILLEFVA